MVALLALVLWAPVDPPERKPTTAKEALQAVSVLVGSWKGTGTPEGTRDEKQAGLWTETISWVWRFKGDEVWLEAAFEKGKYFSMGKLSYNVEKSAYQLTLTTPDKATLVYTGALKD